MSRHETSLRVAGNALVLAVLTALAAWLASLQLQPWLQVAPTRMQVLAATAITAAYLVACALPWWRRHTQARSDARLDDDAWLVAYASQTGFAEQLAVRTAQALREAGQPAELRELGTLDAASLAQRRCLFVASTTGEGDPPDGALGFVRKAMGTQATLDTLQYAVLALGDRNYTQFCAFGHQLDDWLRHAGARPLFDLVEVDNADPGALRHWQHHLGVLAGAPELPDWSPAPYQHWRLVERRLLNPGSAGGPVHALRLLPDAIDTLGWQAGDIAEIGPRNPPIAVEALLQALALPGNAAVLFAGEQTTLADALSRAHLPAASVIAGLSPQAVCERLRLLPHREYSIASLPASAGIDLLVRGMPREDGTPGLGSGWLCEYAAIGEPIDLRIRGNRNFHPPEASRPMILVGNGTGIAGLRAHLLAREAVGANRNWLLFGERSAAHDGYYADDIRRWQSAGVLERLDLVWSRDGGTHRYVQDALRADAEALRTWIDDGACVYVCGSLQGMAPAVDAVLRDALGDARVDQLLASGRYRRDVY